MNATDAASVHHINEINRTKLSHSFESNGIQRTVCHTHKKSHKLPCYSCFLLGEYSSLFHSQQNQNRSEAPIELNTVNNKILRKIEAVDKTQGKKLLRRIATIENS